MTCYETILCDVPSDGVLRITLNRPSRRNAINVQMMLDVDVALRAASQDESVRVVLIAAAGDAFCAGHELDRSAPLDAEWEAKRGSSEGRLLVEHELYYEKTLYLRNFPKPTIAVVQGPAVAAGWSLAGVCDLILASERARFQNPMAKMATAGPIVLTECWDLSVRKAKELLFTGDWLSAEEGRSLGFVNRLFGHAELETEAVKLAKRIAAMPPWALRLIKNSLNYTLDEMGQSRSWQYQFAIRNLGHASEERLRRVTQLKAGGSVRTFLDARDQAVE